jgi:hypothetical protein
MKKERIKIVIAGDWMNTAKRLSVLINLTRTRLNRRHIEAELVLKSKWVVPKKLTLLGFEFQTPTLTETLKILDHENIVAAATQPVVATSFLHAQKTQRIFK